MENNRAIHTFDSSTVKELNIKETADVFAKATEEFSVLAANMQRVLGQY